ncbi:hypothetical protein GS426_18140 [Rhodococcus hoagii]|nr:hypothetical protein [Prescottella equi]
MTGTGSVVVGLGNEYRRDDGFGPAVARALRARIPVTIPVTTVRTPPTARRLGRGRLAIVVDLVVPALLPRAGCAGGRSTTPRTVDTHASTSRPRSPSRGCSVPHRKGDRVRDVE